MRRQDAHGIADGCGRRDVHLVVIRRVTVVDEAELIFIDFKLHHGFPARCRGRGVVEDLRCHDLGLIEVHGGEERLSRVRIGHLRIGDPPGNGQLSH